MAGRTEVGMLRTFALRVTLAITALLLAQPALAQDDPNLPPSYIGRFVFNLDYDLDTLIVGEQFSYLDGTQGLAISGGGASPSAGINQSVDYNIFATTRQSFFVGTTQFGDPGGPAHLVLGLNSAYVAAGQDFSTLFQSATVGESDLIAAVQRYVAGGDFSDPVYGGAVDQIFGFSRAVYESNAGFFPYGGSNGGQYTLYAFSAAQPIGFGSATVDGPFIDVSAAPEPGAWAMMIVGFGLVGTALRRRRVVVAIARA